MVDEQLHGLRGRRESHVQASGDPLDVHHGALAEIAEGARGLSVDAGGALDLGQVRQEALGQVPGRQGRGMGGLGHPTQEEVDPGFPVALRPHAVQQSVILRLVGLEVEAQVEQRARKLAGLLEHQRDDQSADPAVAVEEGMDGLELHVREGRADERRQAVLGVDELIQLAHAGQHLVRGRGHIMRQARARTADPVLRAPELAGLLLRPATLGHELGVHLADETSAQREGPQARHPVLHRGDVARHFLHVIDRHLEVIQFEEHQVGQRGLRPLDLGREHRFLAHVSVKEQVDLRQEQRGAIQLRQRGIGLLQEATPGSRHLNPRSRRQGTGHKGPHLLPLAGGDLPSTRETSLHSPLIAQLTIKAKSVFL